MSTSYSFTAPPEAFYVELEALTKRVYADRRPEDLAHRRALERWGRVSTIIGYATAWLGVNPISAAAIAFGISVRWTMAHHILHRGYDAYPEATPRERSATFGRGFRRWLDWCDWLPIQAWVHEHNGLHHYRLGEPHDPDVPEVNLQWMTDAGLPMALRYLFVAFGAVTWKWSYYGPRVLQVAHRKTGALPGPYSPTFIQIWNPFDATARRVWLRSWLPYAGIRFGLLPALFLPLGTAAWLAVLLNTLLAEMLTNLQSFVLVVTNHAGEDIPRFTTPPKDRNDFRLRQIVGSVNFRTGGDRNDLVHGWLNYQIEHHVWPDLSLRQYQTWQPELRELCERYRVPYCQESVWVRVRKMVHNIVGKSRMPVLPIPVAGPAMAGAT